MGLCLIGGPSPKYNRDMPDNQPRKRLSERVADRKAGRDKPERNPKQEAIRYRFELFGNVIAMIGLLMLAWTVFQSQGSTTGWATDNFIMYAGIFVLGRLIKVAAKPFSKMFN